MNEQRAVGVWLNRLSLIGLDLAFDHRVEADEHGLDAALGECREQREQVALRAADTADAVHVQRLHRVRNRWMARSIVAAASSASKKSQATR